MAVPKRKTTKSRAGKRRSHMRISQKNIIEDKRNNSEINRNISSEGTSNEEEKRDDLTKLQDKKPNTSKPKLQDRRKIVV